ncbi:MAG: tetratricopeptide repeat protein [Candidatus Zixiibacteriota bacterium]
MKKTILILLVILVLSLGAENSSKQLPEIDKLWNYSDPAGTETEFEKLLSLVEQDINYKGELLTQIARAQGLQGKFDEAKATLAKVEEMLDETGPKVEARYYLELGRMYKSSGKAEESREYFEKAWDIAKGNAEMYHAMDAAHMMAIVSEPDKQLVWALKAIALGENSDDPKVKTWLGPLYNNTGWTYHEKGQYEKALELWQKGLKLREEAGSLPEIMIAKWTVARAHRSLENYDKALEMQNAILEERAENNLPPDGYVYEELGELYLEKGNDELAKENFARAYELLSQDQWIMQNEKERMARIKELSE